MSHRLWRMSEMKIIRDSWEIEKDFGNDEVRWLGRSWHD